MMRSTWIALAALVSLTLAAQQCSRAPSTSRPALAWDGDDYITAWRSGPNIYVQLEGRTPQIVYSDASVGDPTIAKTASGAIISTSRAADDEKGWRDEILIPLDRDGFPATPRTLRHAVSADATCTSQQSFGLFITAYAGHWRDGRAGQVISVYDARGVQVAGDAMVWPFPDVECALVERGGEVAFVDRSEWNLVVSVRNAIDLRWIEDPFALPIQEAGKGAPWHLAVAPRTSWGTSYSALYRDRHGTLRVTQFTAHGPGPTRALDDDVDAMSVDIGHTRRGTFVTWAAGRTLHVRDLDERPGQDRTLAVSPGTRVRAGGHWDTCAIALLAPGGDRATIADFERCP